MTQKTQVLTNRSSGASGRHFPGNASGARTRCKSLSLFRSRLEAAARHFHVCIESPSTEIAGLADQDAACKRLMTVSGGPIISSAMVAAIGTGDVFSKGRDHPRRRPGVLWGFSWSGTPGAGGALTLSGTVPRRPLGCHRHNFTGWPVGGRARATRPRPNAPK